MNDLLNDPTLAALVDEHEQLLRSRHPKLARYLDLMHQPLKQWGGEWLVLDTGPGRLGTIYASEADAIEACKAVIMQKLIEVDRAAQ